MVGVETCKITRGLMTLLLSIIIGMVVATIVMLLFAIVFVILALTWLAIKQICGLDDSDELYD